MSSLNKKVKYIITESQDIKLKILRRMDEDSSLLEDIVDEGVDIDDPCDYKNGESYLHRICIDSARTYLNYFFFDTNDKGPNSLYSKLLRYVHFIIEKRMGDDIIEYYKEKRDDC